MLPVPIAETMVACWDADTDTGSNGPHPWDGDGCEAEGARETLFPEKSC